VLNVLSSAGASILGVAYLMPMAYLLWSLKYGREATQNPWNATGLEWEEAATPPTTYNFDTTPIVTRAAYDYDFAGAHEEPPTEVSHA
jgi:cytochrome c oxidase subunit I